MDSLESTLPYLIRYSYLGVYGLILLFSFVLPFSKTLVIVGAGILASQGIGGLSTYAVVSLVALVTADSIYYTVGYVGGKRVLKWRVFSGAQKKERFREAEERFRRHQWFTVFSARFLPFLRTLVFVVAGLNRMPPLRFLQADFLSACILVPLAILSGYFFSEKREILVRFFREGEFVLGFLVFLGLIVLLLVPRRSRGDDASK